MARAATAGTPPHQFWNLTLREYEAIMTGARERDLRRVEIAIIAAWHEAAFSRTKDLPKLAGILARLRRPENKPAMTGEQLFAAIKGMNALMGGKVIHKNTGK